MSTHPNVILMAVLTPDGLSRATMRNILVDTGTKDNDEIVIPRGMKVKYEPGMPPIPFGVRSMVMESDYDEDHQIAAKEGDLVFFDLVTGGYGKVISWHDLDTKKTALEEWAKDICARFNCKYEIRVSANYW